MHSLVIYASRSGNTRTVAEAIARGLEAHGTARVASIDEVAPARPAGVDLLVIGAPTEGHGIYPPMVQWLDRLPSQAMADLPVVAFDTRINWPRVLSGSAAAGISTRLTRLGARQVAPPESFIVDRKPALLPGEADRATAWGAALGVAEPVAVG